MGRYPRQIGVDGSGQSVLGLDEAWSKGGGRAQLVTPRAPLSSAAARWALQPKAGRYGARSGGA